MAGQRYCRHIDDKPRNVATPLNDASAPLNNANMPSLRHSYTLTLADNLPQHKAADAQRKNPPHKLVSTLMGLIINPVKVSPPRLLVLLLRPLSYGRLHSNAPSSG